jgi:hypothetical protein
MGDGSTFSNLTYKHSYKNMSNVYS